MMEQKVIKILSIIFFSLLMLSCSCSKKNCNVNIYGTWIDIENKDLKIILDSLSNELTIDYSKTGGKVFKSKFSIQNTNELKSDLLPKGAKFEIDKNLQLKFYPIVKDYQRDIENIYVLRFAKSL